MNNFKNIAFGCVLILSFFSSQAQQISLAGEWRFAIDEEDKGIGEEWYKTNLQDDAIMLPGSMAENHKGDEVSLATQWTSTIYDSSYFFRKSMEPYRKKGNVKIPFWLSPVTYYVGAAWYQRTITIPKDWKKKKIQLYLERCHIQSDVWVDDMYVGKANSLVSSHEFVLPNNLKAGEHLLTIRIDNRIDKINVGPDSHSVGDHTQGNWNGIIGKMYLEAKPIVEISNLQVYPDVENKKATVQISLINTGKNSFSGKLILRAESYNTPEKQEVLPVELKFKAIPLDTTLVETEIVLGDKMLLWDEFNPALYKLSVSLEKKDITDSRQVTFGMRSMGTSGMHLTVNGNVIHLRGDLNNCEFPLTGYPDMDVAGWRRIYQVAKDHGLNHFRFHSWCPPEAAFIAADEMGFYLQPEGPTWPNHGTSLGDGRFIDHYLYEETARIMNDYGNHPSFCLFAAGNEPAGGHQAEYLEKFTAYFKKQDPRHLYTGASVAMSWPLYPWSDFMIKSGPRGLDWKEKRPETMSDYREKIEDFHIPYITHEMGQWCVFPDFKEIKEYKGVMQAKNFELFKEDLKDHNMGNQAEDFLMASGKLQVLCYKQEIEKSLRTANSAGFQLLGLQDFSGQGTALIGVLNAFWEEKEYVTAEEWRRFCNTTVLLSRIPKFTYTNNEVFKAELEIYHYGKSSLQNAIVTWELIKEKGEVVKSGNFRMPLLPRGTATHLGELEVPLNAIKEASKLQLVTKLEDTDVTNNWDIWVYPKELSEQKTDIYITDTLDAKVEAILEKGGTVFLNAAGKIVKGDEVRQYFTPVFWNTSWFKMRPPHTLGIWVDMSSAAFKYFPTSYHSDLQWWEIVNKSQVMHLENFPKGFRPLIQPIDTWFMNRKLGLLIEAKIGNGKMIICSADLFSGSSDRIVARQLLYSLKKYMASEEFNPKEEVSLDAIKQLFTEPSKEIWDSFTKDTPDELKPLKLKKGE